MTCKKCKELIEYLSDYADNVLEKQLCACIEEHKAECDECRQMIEDFLKTLEIASHLEKDEVPVSMQEKILSNIKKCLDS
jgi:predicted anti-sigma-YlaC factor YlaD